MTFVMVLSNACDDVLDRVVDQATYESVLVICERSCHMRVFSSYACGGLFLPFLSLERCCKTLMFMRSYMFEKIKV